MIIKRTEKDGIIDKTIEETITFAEVIEKGLYAAIDFDEEIDNEILQLINSLITIKKCYLSANYLMNEENNDSIMDFKIKIYLLIQDKLRELKVLFY